jgi:hypothetical protein
MGHVSFANGLQYVGYALELCLLILLLSGKRLRRFPALCAYVAALFAVDAVGRRWVLQHYGAPSKVYFYSYWLTDLLLALGVFLLVCTFFRSACRDHREVWAFVRPTLAFILLLVVGCAAAALRSNFRNLWSSYIFNFEQDLYFVCLVLNTALYLMLQRYKRGNQYLHLLVCGLGVQLAGPAAGSAFASLMHNGTILMYLSPLCFMAMMAIWTYAITRPPETQAAGAGGQVTPQNRITPGMQFKAVPAAGRNHRMATSRNAWQASYLHG